MEVHCWRHVQIRQGVEGKVLSFTFPYRRPVVPGYFTLMPKASFTTRRPICRHREFEETHKLPAVLLLFVWLLKALGAIPSCEQRVGIFQIASQLRSINQIIKGTHPSSSPLFIRSIVEAVFFRNFRGLVMVNLSLHGSSYLKESMLMIMTQTTHESGGSIINRQK